MTPAPWAGIAKHISDAAAPGKPLTGSAPDLLGKVDDHPQLGPLLLLGQHVALLARSEAALRAQAQLIEIDHPGGLVDAPPDQVPVLEPAGLGGDEAEHDHAVLRHQLKR